MNTPSAYASQADEPSTQEHLPRFPLVGIGASAGGIQVLQTFFDGMTADSGMAFVVVMHLAPDYESSLAQILQHHTAMPVSQVSGTIQVEPNHVYVIPPGKHLTLQEDTLALLEPQQPAGRRIAVDLFFRTLAASYGARAISIVLSGTDSDGVIGIKHIKEQGGLTIVQEPTEAEFDSMPRGAIATGMVDWVLPAAEMPRKLLELMQNERRMHVPLENVPREESGTSENNNSGGPVNVKHISSTTDETALVEVLRVLRGQTGHDFSHYKRATILRRVARRLQVNLLEDIPLYLEFLRSHPAETTALLHDFLISVTNFFRDRDAFAALESHIAQIFADKKSDDQVRVWVAGCATGEEAYSVAILLSEHAAKLDNPPSIQVFATDLDEDVIQIARAGLYPPTIEADVSPERLRRFFQKDQGRYRINKEIRERVLFSAHNVLRDSPFSRLDLITCRNLLIYIKREAQESVFDIFHFALRSGGMLFLGSSESLDDSHSQFAPLDKPHRLYVRRSVPRRGWQLPSLPLPSLLSRGSAPTVPLRSLPPLLTPSLSEGTAGNAAPLLTQNDTERRFQLSDLHLSVVEQFAPPSVIINDNEDIVHLSEHAGRFLQFSGEATMNLLKVVHPALRVELRTVLFRATREGTNVSASPVAFDLDGTAHWVTLHVRPIQKKEAGENFLLVVFDAQPTAQEERAALLPAQETTARHLEDEIQHLKEQLSDTVEQYEASVEELKASNEELQAMNEEMRSATEELETGKEELQSINEELITVNQELKSSVEELSRANSDVQNLMASTEIGTIFLDRELRIKRFTPRIQELFNVIPTDLGRPLSDITHKFHDNHLQDDAARVLRNLQSSEREVGSGGRWFLARVLPYRTLNEHLDGVVIALIDITERKRGEEALREAQQRLEIALEAAEMGVWDIDLITGITQTSLRHDQIFGYTEPVSAWGIEQFRKHLLPEDEEIFTENYQQALKTGILEIEMRICWNDGSIHWIYDRGRVYYDAEGSPVRMIGVVIDMTERRQTEEHQLILERETTVLEERNRMAQELHDTLAQGFTGIKLQLDSAEDAMEAEPPEPDEVMERLRRAREIARLSLIDARNSISGLRSSQLIDGSLISAFERLCSDPPQGVAVWFELQGTPYALSSKRENDLYRIGQEALTNALRHAQARQITLLLCYEATSIRLSIEDDGQGFDPTALRDGFGITGMRERAQQQKAELEINSQPGQGTQITFIIGRAAHSNDAFL